MDDQVRGPSVKAHALGGRLGTVVLARVAGGRHCFACHELVDGVGNVAFDGERHGTVRLLVHVGVPAVRKCYSYFQFTVKVFGGSLAFGQFQETKHP